MKTLVLQLARLGDIVQSLPVIKGYCRQNPNEELHLLVREKFSEIAQLLPVGKRLITLKTKDILKDALSDDVDVDKSVHMLEDWLSELRAEGYDKIINLSFSPFSSYLCRLIAEADTRVLGYSRHVDGFLSIPDDPSAYFYGQVGIGKANRFHLIDLFSSIMEVDLIEDDWSFELPKSNLIAHGSFVAFHVGASNAQKTLPPRFISKLILGLLKTTHFNFYLVGSNQEIPLANEILQHCPSDRVVSLVGKTNLSELISIIARADYFIGADSGPLQLCNITGTTAINFSNEYVNFWETGPRCPKSFVCYVDDFKHLEPSQVIEDCSMIFKENKSILMIEGDRHGYYGKIPTNSSQNFQWDLIRAIYLGEEFPIAQSSAFAKALVHLNEVNEIALHHLSNFQLGNVQQVKVLETADQIVDTLGLEVEEIRPIINWFRTEKIRVGPMPLTDLVVKYSDLHKKLKKILDLYLKPKWEITEDLL